MDIIVRGGIKEILEELYKLLKELKEALGNAKDGKEALEAIDKALDYAEKGEDDPLEVLRLIGEAIKLARKVLPKVPVIGPMLDKYAEALDLIVPALDRIPLTLYDKAIDKAYREHKDVQKATEQADRLLPDTPQADRARGIKRVTREHLKNTYVPTVPLRQRIWRRIRRWVKGAVSVVPSLTPGGTAAVGVMASLVFAGALVLRTGDAGDRGMTQSPPSPMTLPAAGPATPVTQPVGPGRDRIVVLPSAAPGGCFAPPRFEEYDLDGDGRPETLLCDWNADGVADAVVHRGTSPEPVLPGGDQPVEVPDPAATTTDGAGPSDEQTDPSRSHPANPPEQATEPEPAASRGDNAEPGHPVEPGEDTQPKERAEPSHQPAPREKCPTETKDGDCAPR